MKTCKDCKHYTPEGDFEKTGLCDMVNTSYHFPVEADKRITYLEAEHGGSYCVGENFGCIHFEQKA
jgi:hypothetical protein